jgi:hypothetical protein
VDLEEELAAPMGSIVFLVGFLQVIIANSSGGIYINI